MDSKKKNVFSPYSESDKEQFRKILPTLYSKAAVHTDFAEKEREKMMELFEKEFGT